MEVRTSLIYNRLTSFSEETEKLLKDFENDSKLSDANPISLCPQATVNGDDLVNLISNPDVKANCFITEIGRGLVQIVTVYLD